MTDPRTVYQRAQCETAQLLGYDADHLSLAEQTKIDVVVCLRLALDDLQSKLLQG